MSHASSLTNHKAQTYQHNANFVYSEEYTSPIFTLLNAQPGEKIIDLGCGTGELTRRISGLVGDDGEVWGLDSSSSMLDKARETSPKSIKYIQADCQTLITTLNPELKGRFDAVFTSATLHWCKSNPGGVVEGIKWLLRPGGRVVFEFGGFGNTVGVRSALHQVLRNKGVDPSKVDPWYFPTVKQYETLLVKHGLRPSNLTLVPRPTPLPTDIHGWLQTFARNTFFAEFGDKDSEEMMSEVQEICRVDNYWFTPGTGLRGNGIGESDTGGVVGESGWEIMYVRLRGVAYLDV